MQNLAFISNKSILNCWRHTKNSHFITIPEASAYVRLRNDEWSWPTPYPLLYVEILVRMNWTLLSAGSARVHGYKIAIIMEYFCGISKESYYLFCQWIWDFCDIMEKSNSFPLRKGLVLNTTSFPNFLNGLSKISSTPLPTPPPLRTYYYWMVPHYQRGKFEIQIQ